MVSDVGEISLFSDQTAVRYATLPPQTPITAVDYPGMVLVPEGPFLMGTLNPGQLRLSGNPEGDEQPVRTVFLDAYLIDRFEVTNGQFVEFVEATGHVTDAENLGTGKVWRETWEIDPDATWRQPMGMGDSITGLDDHPVVQVSWADADAFCTWAGKRLPTEAEWEKAARGVDARDYPWGTDFEPRRLNFCDSSCQVPALPHHEVSDGYARTAPVGSFPQGASPYGVMDMVGNVWEWVGDWYDPDYYTYAPDRNPQGPSRRRAHEASKVVRGGSFAAEPAFTRATSRSFDPHPESFFGVGFRCALDVSPEILQATVQEAETDVLGR
jgi:formylglycine-generating enzyme required for sulfatase activity